MKNWLTFDEVYPILEIERDGSDGWYSARCPAHDDERASLGIKEGEFGELLVHCFAGCSKVEIIAEIRSLLQD